MTDFPDVSFSDPRVKTADMSGDQLQDIVIIDDGSVVYYPNLGHGDWGLPVHMRNGPPASLTATICAECSSATWTATAWPT